MSKGDFLGEFELLVMLAISRLGANAYGMTIRRVIQDTIDRDAAIGSVYAALERLERKGLVRSELGEATAERGGRAKRFYKVSADGQRAIEVTEKARSKLGARVSHKPAWGSS